MMGVAKDIGKYWRAIAIVFLTLAFTVACKSKPKADDAAANPEGKPMDAAVSQKDMSFEATGSDSGKIDGLQTVHFDLDQSSLTSDSRKELAGNSEWIKSHPKTTVQIEGHCDKRGSTEYNLALGERRAKAVKNYLSTMGVNSKRMTVISYGEEKPLDPADTEEAYAKNRRANFVPLNQ